MLACWTNRHIVLAGLGAVCPLVWPLMLLVDPHVLVPSTHLLCMHSVEESVCLQVLLDDVPGLLGSIVDVRITGHSRWCTFGEICDWVYRCPAPPAPEPAAASAGLLRARARVAAARQQAKATALQPPRSSGGAAAAAPDADLPRDGGAAACGAHDGDGGAGSSARGGDPAAGGVAAAQDGGSERVTGFSRRWGSWGRAGESVCSATSQQLGNVAGWISARPSTADMRAEEDAQREASQSGRVGPKKQQPAASGWGSEDVMLLGGVVVGLLGLAAAAALALQQRRAGPAAAT